MKARQIKRSDLAGYKVYYMGRIEFDSKLPKSIKLKLTHIGYNAGVYGWNYDAFKLKNSNVVITVGHRPLGTRITVDGLKKLLKVYNTRKEVKNNEIRITSSISHRNFIFSSFNDDKH